MRHLQVKAYFDLQTCHEFDFFSFTEVYKKAFSEHQKASQGFHDDDVDLLAMHTHLGEPGIKTGVPGFIQASL